MWRLLFLARLYNVPLLLFPFVSLLVPFLFYASFLVLSIFSLIFPYVLNGRSRVSRGNKMQKQRKFA